MEITRIFAFLLLLVYSQKSFGQYEAPSAQSFKYTKNIVDVVYGSVGITGALIASYQRFLLKSQKY